VLQTAGFVVRVDDVLLRRRPKLMLADPIVRFHQLIVEPRLPQLEERHADEVWAASTQTFASNILGPHFEDLARAWTAWYGRDEGLREPVGVVGPTVLNDREGHSQHEIDVVGLAEGQAIYTGNPRVVVLGEAKNSVRQRTLADLDRLGRLRTVLVARGVDALRAQLVLFARNGADEALRREVSARDDALVVDLRALYGLRPAS
jgi:hypothetical protein